MKKEIVYLKIKTDLKKKLQKEADKKNLSLNSLLNLKLAKGIKDDK